MPVKKGMTSGMHLKHIVHQGGNIGEGNHAHPSLKKFQIITFNITLNHIHKILI
jgi:hypothetical protein